jgi:hypothetical protein
LIMEDGKARQADPRGFYRGVALAAALQIAAAAALAWADPSAPAALIHVAAIGFGIVILAALASIPVRWMAERQIGAPPFRGAWLKVLELRAVFVLGAVIALPVLGLAAVLEWVLEGSPGPIGRAWAAFVIVSAFISTAGILIANTLSLFAPRSRSV